MMDKTQKGKKKKIVLTQSEILSRSRWLISHYGMHIQKIINISGGAVF